MKDEILKNLRREIEKLQHELRVELPKEIGIARELGDLSENAEYQMAEYVQARLAQLEGRYQQLNMLDFSKIPRDRIGLGSEIVAYDLDNDKEVTYLLVIAEEADVASGKISAGSPLGSAFIGKREGDEVKVEVPSGRREFEIISFKTIYDRFGD